MKTNVSPSNIAPVTFFLVQTFHKIPREVNYQFFFDFAEFRKNHLLRVERNDRKTLRTDVLRVPWSANFEFKGITDCGKSLALGRNFE